MSLWGSIAQAIPEAGFAEVHTATVQPWFDAHAQSGEIRGADGLRLRYRMIRARRTSDAALVILPGRSEPAVKYAELAYDLSDLGFDIYLLDHRGQGASERIAKDPEVGHVAAFEDYVSDFERFVTQVVNATSYRKKFLIAHSMGAAVSTLYLAQHPTEFRAAIFSPPMYDVITEPYPRWVARSIVQGAIVLGQSEHYAKGKGPFDPNEKFNDSTVSRSRARWNQAHALSVDHPDLRLGGPSNAWVNAALSVRRLERKASETFRTPLLMFQAGDESIVVNAEQDYFCTRVSSCRLSRLEDSLHEVFMERDSIRNRVLAETRAFLKAHR